jgi:hypothetical protein
LKRLPLMGALVKAAFTDDIGARAERLNEAMGLLAGIAQGMGFRRLTVSSGEWLGLMGGLIGQPVVKSVPMKGQFLAEGLSSSQFLFAGKRVEIETSGTLRFGAIFGVKSYPARTWARMLDALEAEHRPDVVLLDSRAGLHDIAAVTITRLDAQVFLFAVGTRQTWDAYETLLSQWQHSRIGAEVRERLKVVAAQIPEEGREGYLRRFEEDAHRMLAATLYEDAAPPPDEDASSQTPQSFFSFALADNAAPHYRLPIYWNRVFQDWDPLSNKVSEDQINAAFGEFLRGASERLFGADASATLSTAPERSPA